MQQKKYTNTKKQPTINAKKHLLWNTSYKIQDSSKGFVLLFAVLISSLVLSISLGIMNIALKEVVLSAAGRESQFGFYSADTGSECAMFWDLKHTGFSESVFPTSTASVIPGSGVVCAGTDITQSWTIVRDAVSGTTRFRLNLSNNACVDVMVQKTVTGTRIDSSGFNTCVMSDARRVERAIRVTY